MFVAGFVWVCVGTGLVMYAVSWLSEESGTMKMILYGAGIGSALVIHHLGFLKIADKNASRLLATEGKRCFFSFIPWKSYLIIVIMVLMGTWLRHSDLPRSYLAILYLGIGIGLILSSIRYLRFFYLQLKK